MKPGENICWDHLSGLLNSNDKWPFKGCYCPYGKVCRFKHCAQHPDVDWALKLTVPMLQQKPRPKKAPIAIYPPTSGGGGGKPQKRRLEQTVPHLEDGRKRDRVTSVDGSDISHPTAMPRRLQLLQLRRPSATIAAELDIKPSTVGHRRRKREAKAKKPATKEPPTKSRRPNGKNPRAI